MLTYIQIADPCGIQLQTFENYMRRSAKRLARQSPITNVLIYHFSIINNVTDASRHLTKEKK